MPTHFFRPYYFDSIKINRGFLPSHNPVSLLPDNHPFHQELNHLIRELPILLKKKQLRYEIDKLNCQYKSYLLDISLMDSRTVAVAMLILTMLSQAYVWETPDSPATQIPRVISANLAALSKKHSRLPALSYQDYVLNNWRLKKPDQGITLENVEPLFTFTGSRDEAWFIIIHIVMEKICGNALRAALQSVLHAKNGQLDSLNQSFNTLSNSLSEANKILKKMKEQCDPDYFFNTLRLYLKDWKEIGGVCFDLDDRTEKIYHEFRGPSGAQSSIIPALDAVMGIKHQTEPVLKIFKQYMPLEHQGFIDYMTSNNLKEIVTKSHQKELITEYENVIQSISVFRIQHFALVKDFIFIPASKLGIAPHKIIGTGGTRVDEYLERRTERTHQVLEEIASTKNTARISRL